MSDPLSGLRVIELAGIGPGPYAGQLLADLGAEVICVERPIAADIPGAGLGAVDERGKKSIVIDLRKPEAKEIVLKLVETADILIEGNRPGVTERLGIGPKDCHAVNPKLVYGRMTGWGQSGPWANMAGHDINYLSITGALNAIGAKDTPPPPPLNLMGDYGGGSMFLLLGILSAVVKAKETGKGDVVDAAIIDGVSSMMGIVYTMHGVNVWNTERQSNLIDSASPFYRCYQTKDDKFMAVGCIEPRFFSCMQDLLGVNPDQYGQQHDRGLWPDQCKQLERVFASRTREEWTAIFEGSDACVTPVLDYMEATEHPQNVARGGLTKQGAFIHPRTAPVFESNPHDDDAFIPSVKGRDTKDILKECGYAEASILKFIKNNVISSH